MKIEESSLYKTLIYMEKYRPPYNVKEIYQFMLGYGFGTKERWISEFIQFMEKKLIQLYTNNEFDRLPRNCSEVIFENQKSDEDGLNLFYNTLQEFYNLKNKTDT